MKEKIDKKFWKTFCFRIEIVEQLFEIRKKIIKNQDLNFEKNEINNALMSIAFKLDLIRLDLFENKECKKVLFLLNDVKTSLENEMAKKSSLEELEKEVKSSLSKSIEKLRFNEDNLEKILNVKMFNHLLNK